MSDRFFVPTSITGHDAQLTGEEARHLVAVMRAKLGDEVTLFDNSGAQFLARITAIQKHSVRLAIIQRHEISRELPFVLTVAAALPKGDRQKWLVEKAAEFGVTRLVPLVTERGVAQPTESAVDRLRRSVIETSKQCGRNRLMVIDPAVPATDFFAAAPLSAARYIADPSGRRLAVDAITHREKIFAIGPEGGFTPSELSAACDVGWQSVSLGARILRVETAAIGLAAWAALACGDSRGAPQGVQ